MFGKCSGVTRDDWPMQALDPNEAWFPRMVHRVAAVIQLSTCIATRSATPWGRYDNVGHAHHNGPMAAARG